MTRQTSLDTTDANALLRLWRSVFPVPLRPRTEKDRKRFLRSNLILHFRPPAVKEKTLTFTLSWGLGGMAATLVLLQMATGILLKFIYVPTPVDAYASVQTIITQVPFGRLVRNLHHWCANLLVVILMLHMLRVFFTGAFHSPRQFNWIIGLVLFTMVLAANLSGYLLPYDQLAYWAVTVITAMLGYIPGIGGWLHRALGNGAELGPQTLPFFYSMHTAVIPVLLVGLMGFHFWRIRKAGGLVVPRKSSEPMDEMPTRIPVVPHLLVREVSTALVLTATVVVLSIFLDAPLSTPANPGLSPNPVRAPWYFAGLQELLLHVHPAVAVSVIPLLAITAMVITPALIVVDALVVKTAPWAVGISPFVRDGILPLLLLSVLAAGYVLAMRKRFCATLNETAQSLFVVMVTALAVLTVVGVFFRGPSMKLIWPI
ncbi:MAG: cytochrome b N-terminal domain-containing protein [Desulfosarcina sp.]|nr:cytochrome b N-terminal domain-containing protein [Desulfosarcina sp.]MBC2766748.1 cytochrome bc complex cytochrome b subunit [Desulfosarcina sp.]